VLLLIARIVGIILLLLGIWLVKSFPDISNFQKRKMTVLGVWIGAAFVIAGLILILFF